jgi:hypothetical protein
MTLFMKKSKMWLASATLAFLFTGCANNDSTKSLGALRGLGAPLASLETTYTYKLSSSDPNRKDSFSVKVTVSAHDQEAAQRLSKLVNESVADKRPFSSESVVNRHLLESVGISSSDLCTGSSLTYR